MNKIIVGTSGGVDSSVTALLLKKQGYEVHGLFMKNWEEDDSENYCSATEDVRDAQSVCDSLDIPLHTVNFASEYWDNVFAYCLEQYKAGYTPNPDILCNREIKFKVFLEHAINLGGEAIATGHYVRVSKDNGQYQLLKGVDTNKDQSYFLYTLGQKQLEQSLFPIGELEKPKVRQLAKEANLATQTKKDSTGICFIGERPFKEFLSRYLPAQPGEIQTPEGQTLGQHDGLMFYTLGQRKGLKIGGQAGSNGKAWYVVAKDIPNNRLIIGQGNNHPLLFNKALKAKELHWISGTAPTTPYSCKAKTRYRQQDQACTITTLDNSNCEVHFAEPQWAITPGQSIVFYQGEECLGGGIINEMWNPLNV